MEPDSGLNAGFLIGRDHKFIAAQGVALPAAFHEKAVKWKVGCT
jgi:hypothetical protein